MSSETPERPVAPRESSALRVPALAVFAGGMVATGALILAAVSGPPYLSTHGVSGWVVLFAAGLFAALLATPFAIEGRLRASQPESDARWDRVVPLWGAVALALVVAGTSRAPAGASPATPWPDRRGS